MTKQEMIERMNAAAKLVDASELDLVDAEERDSFYDYWAGSASQSYVNAVESGNVRHI